MIIRSHLSLFLLCMLLEIFENGLLKESSSLTLGHMQVKIDEQASESDDQITYLYK